MSLRSGDARHSLADFDAAREGLGFAVTVQLDEGSNRTITALATRPGSSAGAAAAVPRMGT